MRIKYDDMKNEFKRVLLKKGFTNKKLMKQLHLLQIKL